MNSWCTNGAHSRQLPGLIARHLNGLPITAARSYRDSFMAASTTQEGQFAWRPQ